jgi:hypothetical protein
VKPAKPVTSMLLISVKGSIEVVTVNTVNARLNQTINFLMKRKVGLFESLYNPLLARSLARSPLEDQALALGAWRLALVYFSESFKNLGWPAKEGVELIKIIACLRF